MIQASRVCSTLTQSQYEEVSSHDSILIKCCLNQLIVRLRVHAASEEVARADPLNGLVLRSKLRPFEQ